MSSAKPQPPEIQRRRLGRPSHIQHNPMKAPAFQFYADDFLAGTMDMSPAEVGTDVSGGRAAGVEPSTIRQAGSSLRKREAAPDKQVLWCS